LALVFNRHPFPELGGAFVWGRFSHLVGGRTPFVALAVPRYFCPSVVAVRHPRKLGRECRETESFAKHKASGKTAKVNVQGPDKRIDARTGDRVIVSRWRTSAWSFPCGYDLEIILLFALDEKLKDRYIRRFPVCP